MPHDAHMHHTYMCHMFKYLHHVFMRHAYMLPAYNDIGK